MSIQINNNFDYKGNQPNFKRDQFRTLKEMRLANGKGFDEGHISYCIETGKHYVYSTANKIDAKLGRWRLLDENTIKTINEDLKKSLAKVAFSSDYNDLKNKPEIPDSEDFASKSYVTETITKIVTDGTINLDGYAKTVDVNRSLNKKVDKVDGYSLISDVEIDRLSKIHNFDDSELRGLLDDKVDKENGKGLSTNDFNNIYKNRVDIIKTNDNGKTFLASDGTYKAISEFDTDLFNNALNEKVDKEEGKGLSSNDYTNDSKVKLDRLYSREEIDNLLYPLLNPYREPTIDLKSTGSIFELGDSVNITFTAKVIKGRDSIKRIEFKIGGNSILKVENPENLTQEITQNLNNTTTVYVEVDDGSKIINKQVTVYFVNKTYYGFVDEDIESINGSILNSSKNVLLKKDQEFEYKNINLNNQKVFYAYPKDYGLLTDIRDGNGYLMLNSYIRSEIIFGNIIYYVYLMANATTINGLKQAFKR